MNISLTWGFEDQEAFDSFVIQYALSTEQAKQFSRYLTMLLTANKEFNLTAVRTIREVITRHFEDSLAIGATIDFTTINNVVDVGSGGGLPGIPLKILFPHISMILIEVVQKKVNFLREVIETLGLEQCSVYSHDWRMFLRKTNYPVELFVSRASLEPAELLRVFKASSSYKKAQVVYWASVYWQASAQEKRLVKLENQYTLEDKQRRLIVFESNER